MKTIRISFDNIPVCASLLSLVILGCLAGESLAVEMPANESPAVDQPALVKVMSFNIRYGTASDGENHWDKRHDLVRQVIQIFEPDLLGVQEALPFQCKYLREQFPEFEFFGRGRESDPDKGEFSAIFFRRDRFAKTDGGHFWLSETPDQPGSRSWDAALPRMVTWVQLKDKTSGNEFVFANTHYDHRGQLARKKSSEVIRSRLIDKGGLPIVLTGDFNAGFETEPYKALIGADDDPKRQLVDTYRSVHEQTRSDEGTFGAWTGKRDGPRIDWILTSPEFTTLNAAIDYHNDSGRYPSDHFPVQAVIRLDE